ncbi:MAG: type II secretion system minor pseudopilin GspJ [Roseibium album]|uniref:type II secretion system minor pseudopilin GspJ n=1 Tax=Roseibium album TaxID=311410 RepID=UPI0032EFE757
MLASQRSRGFTLIEMLVVFAVFAAIGVISSRIVSSVIANQAVVAERGQRLIEVQRAMQIIQRDVMQISARGVRDQLGDPLEPVLIGADGLIEFTRLGWRNPLAQRRADAQRVGYVTEEGTLYRAYWPVLDRTPDSEPVLQQLLSDVEQIEFFALDATGDEHSFWPQAGTSADDPGSRLAAVVMRVDVAPFGTVERLWPVPAS